MSLVLQNRKSFQDINTPEDIYRLFEDKELYIRAVLGEYGNIRFLEQLKKKFFSNGFENNATGDTALTPYLMEFHISTSLSLFHLWLNREKDLPPEQLFSLIHTLYTTGIGGVSE